MVHALGFVVLLAFAPAPENALSVTARVNADVLTVGQEYEIVLDVQFNDGWSGSESGIGYPILQINVPDSVELTGKVLTKYRELSRNEFLQEPFERLLKQNPAKIGFKLLKEPSADDRLELKVIAYGSPSSGDGVWLLRRHISLPIAAKATGEAMAATNSSWGQLPVLQIGDKATSFSLPRADGSKVSLGKFRGKKNVIVTTYRAFW